MTQTPRQASPERVQSLLARLDHIIARLDAGEQIIPSPRKPAWKRAWRYLTAARISWIQFCVMVALGAVLRGLIW
jgi:hypothetical protein